MTYHYKPLSCLNAGSSDMCGFDVPLEASIVADLAEKERDKARKGKWDRKHGIAIAVHDELVWNANLAWDRFCGRPR